MRKCVERVTQDVGCVVMVVMMIMMMLEGGQQEEVGVCIREGKNCSVAFSSPIPTVVHFSCCVSDPEERFGRRLRTISQ